MKLRLNRFTNKERGAMLFMSSLFIAVLLGWIKTPRISILWLAFVSILACFGFFWSSIRMALGETKFAAEDAFALGSLKAEEEKKQSVLRTLRDLEFERGVGKINDQDYNFLKQKYRNEAKKLLKQMDEEIKPLREKAEQLMNDRKQEDPNNPRKPDAQESNEMNCTSCHSMNDLDALFCKKCGNSMKNSRNIPE